MKLNKNIFGLSLFSFLLSSCITVINPLVTSKNIVAKDEVVGNWRTAGYDISIEKYLGSDLDRNDQIDASEKLTIAESLKKMSAGQRKIIQNVYIVHFKKNGILHLMGLKFTVINNELYAQTEAGFALKTAGDTIPRNDTNVEALEIFPNAEPSYTIAKATFANNSLQLRFVNTDFLEQLLNNGAIAIKYEEDPLFGTKVITASSEELEKFMAKYGKDERLYSEEKTILLHRKFHE